MTDSHIVDFPSPKRPTREERAAQDRHDRAELIERLCEVLDRNPKMGDEDKIIVARALFDLLVRIEQKYGIRKAEVFRKASIGNPEDPTKHLSYYAISRDLPPEDINVHLRKKTKPYRKLAEAAASLAELDEGDALLEVFGSASFWHGDLRIAEERYRVLARRLRLVADWISAEYKLTDFFRDVERAGVSPAPTSACVQRDAEKNHLFGKEVAIEYRSQVEVGDVGLSLGWPIEFNQLTWLGECEGDRHDLPVYPSIVLGAWRLGSPFPIEAKTPVSATGWPAVVLRLCIAPIGKEREATPVLRVDLWAYIVLNPGGTDHWVLLRPGRVILANHEMNIERVPKLTKPFTPGDAERHLSMEGVTDVVFLPIKGRVCEDWFRFNASGNLYHTRQWPLRDRALGYSLCEDFNYLGVPFSEFGCDTLAGHVDAALSDPAAGIDRLLEQQVKRLKEAFEASRRAVRDLRDRNWAVVKKRWETDENP